MLPRRPEAPAVGMFWSGPWPDCQQSVRSPYGRQHCTGTSFRIRKTRICIPVLLFSGSVTLDKITYTVSSSSFGKMRITFWGLSEVIDVKSQAERVLIDGWLFPNLPLMCEHTRWTHPMPCSLKRIQIMFCDKRVPNFFYTGVPNLFVPKIPTQMLIKA